MKKETSISAFKAQVLEVMCNVEPSGENVIVTSTGKTTPMTKKQS